jgi:hypothetical protein
MTFWILGIVEWLAACLVIIFVHECGHYWAGRLVGIPSDRMHIQMWKFPQHVALLASDEWVSPTNYRRYTQEVQRYITSRLRLTVFVSGGLVSGSLFVLLLCPMLTVSGHLWWAFYFFYLSASIHLIYFIVEILIVSLLRHQIGDFSGLWFISKRAFFLISAIVALCHVLVWVILRYYSHPITP